MGAQSVYGFELLGVTLTLFVFSKCVFPAVAPGEGGFQQIYMYDNTLSAALASFSCKNYKIIL